MPACVSAKVACCHQMCAPPASSALVVRLGLQALLVIWAQPRVQALQQGGGAGDQQPDLAEHFLKLATAYVRRGLPPHMQGGSTAAGLVDGAVAAAAACAGCCHKKVGRAIAPALHLASPCSSCPHPWPRLDSPLPALQLPLTAAWWLCCASLPAGGLLCAVLPVCHLAAATDGGLVAVLCVLACRWPSVRCPACLPSWQPPPTAAPPRLPWRPWSCTEG